MILTIVLILMLISMIGLCIYHLQLVTKKENVQQYTFAKPLFEQEYVFKESANEDEQLNCEFSNSKNLERWALTYRGSVRMATATYFSPQEYQEYRKTVLEKELP